MRVSNKTPFRSPTIISDAREECAGLPANRGPVRRGCIAYATTTMGEELSEAIPRSSSRTSEGRPWRGIGLKQRMRETLLPSGAV